MSRTENGQLQSQTNLFYVDVHSMDGLMLLLIALAMVACQIKAEFQPCSTQDEVGDQEKTPSDCADSFRSLTGPPKVLQNAGYRFGQIFLK